ncbi:MAG: TonB-dependent receptor, partial [Pseudomonadota bacterium]
FWIHPHEISIQEANEVTLDSKVPYTSRWTTGVSAVYEIPVSALSDLSLRADWAYRTAFFTQAANDPIVEQDAYGVLDLTAAYRFDERWEFLLGGTNVLSKEYLIGATNSLNSSLGFAEGNFAPPAEWFATFRAFF